MRDIFALDKNHVVKISTEIYWISVYYNISV